MSSDFEKLKSVVLTRESVRAFSGEPLEKGVLEEILGYALRTPTSNNLQPYRMIIVRDADKKDLLASCMSNKNTPKVKNSGASVIICSDMDTAKCVEDFGKFAYGDQWKEKCEALIHYASTKYYRNTLSNFLFGWMIDVMNCIKRLFRPATCRITMQSWTNQQASLLMMNILLLAQSKGIMSLVINGYDEDKIRISFKIPKRFHVSGVVSLGYKPEGYIYHSRPRFPFEKMVFEGYWKKQFMRDNKRGAKKGRERVLVENEDDIIARNMMERDEKKKRRDEESEEESEEESGSSSSSDANESDEEPVMRRPNRREVFKKEKPEKPIFETESLNRGVKKGPVSSDGTLKVELSGKQKRELEQEQARQAYFQRTLEGKTPQAKADLERLAKIRAQREEAARRRKEEEAPKAAMEARIKEQARLKNKK